MNIDDNTLNRIYYTELKVNSILQKEIPELKSELEEIKKTLKEIKEKLK